MHGMNSKVMWYGKMLKNKKKSKKFAAKFNNFFLFAPKPWLSVLLDRLNFKNAYFDVRSTQMLVKIYNNETMLKKKKNKQNNY